MSYKQNVKEQLERNIRRDFNRSACNYLLINIDSFNRNDLLRLESVLNSGSARRIEKFANSLDRTSLIPTRQLETTINLDSNNMSFEEYQNKLRAESVSQMNGDSLGTVSESLMERFEIAKEMGDWDTATRLMNEIQSELGGKNNNELADYIGARKDNLNKSFQPSYVDPTPQVDSYYDDESMNYDSEGYVNGVWDGNSLEAQIAKADGNYSSSNRDSPGINFDDYQNKLRGEYTKLVN